MNEKPFCFFTFCYFIHIQKMLATLLCLPNFALLREGEEEEECNACERNEVMMLSKE